jgi:predicted RND superfamily exporter protein
MVSSMLTAIVTVIGVATTMHLLLRYQDTRRRGAARRDALRESLAALMVPIGLACVTDAVGFISLMAANVGPVRDFGLMMAIGSLVVLLSILLLVPGLALIGKWDSDPHVPKSDLAVRMALRKLLDLVLANRRLGIMGLVLIAIVSLVGGFRMLVETDFTKNFYSSNPLVQGYQVVESELGGAGVWDVMLPAPKAISQEYLNQIMQLETQLRALSATDDGGNKFSLTKVLSMADADLAARVEPRIGALPVTARLEGMRWAMPEFSQALLTYNVDTSGLRWLRIMLRSREQTTASVKSQLIQQVTTTVAEFTEQLQWRELFDDKMQFESLSGEVTGYHVMLSRLVSSVLEDQWKCFAFATLGIFGIMLIATRSLVFSLAALVPNALPIIVVLGAMGWLGIRVNMGAAMIAAVSMGLSIDSSIHYLLHYQRRLRAGDRPLKALRSAQENVGFAVVLATVALIAGFLALAVSEFVPTVVFGTLTSLTMLGGLIGNLIALPLLVAPRK